MRASAGWLAFVGPDYSLQPENDQIIVGNLALTYKDQGRWQEAEKLGVEVV